jgi:four helix bundle protein
VGSTQNLQHPHERELEVVSTFRQGCKLLRRNTLAKDEQVAESLIGIRRAKWVCVPATNSFRDLEVWQESMTLVEDVYRISKRFPRDERFVLTAQIRRAAVSIPSNIGEGSRRKRKKAYLYHLDIALGSQGEVEVQMEVGKRLGFCSAADYARVQQRIERVGRMLNGLIRSLQPDERFWEK